MADSSRIAVVSDAGSAGKTTTVVALAALLAAQSRTVLVIDLDAQANATRSLGVLEEDVTTTSVEVLLRQATLAAATVPTTLAGVELVPATAQLTEQRILLGAQTGAEQRLRLALLEDRHDVVLIDCQAGVRELLPTSALIAATAAVTVTLPTYKETDGVPRTEQMVRDVAEAYNPALRLAAVVPCAVPPANRGRFYVEAMQRLADSYADLLTPPVRHSVLVGSAYADGIPLPEYAPTAPVTEDYRAVLAYLQVQGVL